MFEASYPQYLEYGEGRTLTNTDITFYLTPAKDIQMAILATEDSDAIIHTPWSGGQGRIIDGSLTATINVMISGRCPHGAIPIPMGRMEVPADWWATPNTGSRRIKLTTGAGDTSSLYELILQQVRGYTS